MLKFLSHFWLILSLLIAPVQFAGADMAMQDNGQMKCEMMDMDGSMNHDMSADGSCECSEQCQTNCAGAHVSLAITTALQMVHLNSSIKLVNRTQSITGIDQLTELRPPIKLHA